MLQCWFLAYSLFSFPVTGEVWRLQSRGVFALLVRRPSSSGFCSWKYFSLLLVPESFLAYVALGIYLPYIQLDTTLQYITWHNSVITSLHLLEALLSAPRSFPFSEVTVICCLTPCTTNFCAFSMTSYLKIIQFMLTYLFSSLFRVSLKWESSASFISIFLTLRAMVINENSRQDSWDPTLKSSMSNSL